MRVENVKGAVWTVDEVEFYKRRPQRCATGYVAPLHSPSRARHRPPWHPRPLLSATLPPPHTPLSWWRERAGGALCMSTPGVLSYGRVVGLFSPLFFLFRVFLVL